MIANVIDWIDTDGELHLGTGEWIYVDKEYQQVGNELELVDINDWMPYNVWIDRLPRTDVQKIYKHCWQRISNDTWNTNRNCKVRWYSMGSTYASLFESTNTVTWAGDDVMFVAPYSSEGGSTVHTGVAFVTVKKDGAYTINSKNFNGMLNTYMVQTTGESTTKIMSQKAVTDALAAAGGGDYVSVASLDEITNPKEGMVAYVRSSQLTITGKEVEFQHYNLWEDWNYVHFNINISDSTGDRVLRCGYNFNSFFNSNGEKVLDAIMDLNKTLVWLEVDGVRFQIKQFENWDNTDANQITFFFDCASDAVITYSCDWEQREDFYMVVTDSAITETLDGRSYIYQDNKWSDYVKYYKIDDMERADIIRLVETMKVKGAEGYTLAWEINDGRLIQSSSLRIINDVVQAYHINGETYSPWVCTLEIRSDGSYYADYRNVADSPNNTTATINVDGDALADIEPWVLNNIAFGWYYDVNYNCQFWIDVKDGDGNTIACTKFSPSVSDSNRTTTGLKEFGGMVQLPNGDMYVGRWVFDNEFDPIREYTGNPDYQYRFAKKSWVKIG